MKKYIGEIFWMCGDYQKADVFGGLKSLVTRGILNEGVFKISHHNPNNQDDGLISLRTKDDFSYDGSMKLINAQSSSAIVNLKLYSNKKNVLLIGNWIEDSTNYNCIIELTEVKEFKI